MKLFIEIVIQTFLAFFAILFITRILGRQQLSQLSMQEYINGITFGSIAATLATDIDQRTWQHLIGLFLFGILTFIVSYISGKNIKFARLMQGEAEIIIQDGKILEKNLQRFHYTIDDVYHLLRKKDVFNIKDVKYGILETTGEISVIKVADKTEVTLGDLKLQGEEDDIKTEIIITGNIIYENLLKRNLTAKWLMGQLKVQGIQDVRDVFYANLDEQNNLYIDQYRDKIQKN
ncbi:YetF domain-containing protein [Alkaliphilus oremlandii]|uniref:DUF421 domain-containing protein n=1 Tax=Alkaliphilus oremlandii (strain OhILAs) TaxID=350688 RepID=A8MIU9_ALKOO|nr:DUF421 domain-containing protein [Alkaliphilus oremlandii]ABW19731.1 protein of unknown function DUF421 [Alkaliphilus oremlandii OhILAs]